MKQNFEKKILRLVFYMLSSRAEHDRLFLERQLRKYFFAFFSDMYLNLARLLKKCPSFPSNIRQWEHPSHKLHLLVILKYFGSEGNASSFSHVTGGLGIRTDSILNYNERTVTVL
jgi:hypothetical protein